MKLSSRALIIIPLLTALSGGAFAQTLLTAGDLLIVERINNGTPDSFKFVPLVDLSVGTVIYFTDNGWTGSQFRGASATDGDGNENLTKFTAAAPISAGTLISSTAATFAITGSIPGSTTGSFASLAQAATGGEQIYAFQTTGGNASVTNPLFASGAQTHLYVLDDSNGFENATSSNTGNVTPGLTAGATALTFNTAVAGTIALNNDGATRNKAQWGAYASNFSNWSTTPITSNLTIPEPGTLALAGLGLLGLALRRRK